MWLLRLLFELIASFDESLLALDDDATSTIDADQIGPFMSA
jgi:hypothetical protein